jgi:hypothetical protein
VRLSSTLSRRWRYLARTTVRSELWRHRTRVVVWSVFLVAIVVEGVLIMQPSGSSQNALPYSAPRAAPTTRAPAPTVAKKAVVATGTKRAPVATGPTRAPVPTVLPAPSPATTLVPASAAEQAAFRAGQRSCQTSPSASLDPVGAAVQAAFEAGHQWCSLTAGGHSSSGTKR